MGKKYGSIHVRTCEGVKVAETVLTKCSRAVEQSVGECAALAWLEGSNRRELLDLARSLRRDRALFGESFFIVITNDCVSLYNRDMSFQTITQKARALAKKLPEPILYTSNFDDDVFVFGLLVDGKTTTSGRICDSPEFYNLTTRTANMAPLRRTLCHGADQPKKMPTDIFELEELLSSMMGVPLFAYAEDLDDDPEHFSLLEERNGIRVYQKLK